MLEALLQSPIITIGIFLFVFWLLATYYMNREKAAANRKRGRRKFQPDWSRRRTTGEPDRRRPFSRKDRRFQPTWKRRSTDPESSGTEEPEREPDGAPESEET